MRNFLLSSLFVWSCGNAEAPIEPPNPKPKSVEAPACGAGTTSLFAETAGDIDSFAATTVDGEVFGVFAASYQFDHAIFFFKMNRRGSVELMERLRLTGAEEFSNPSIVKNGNGFGVAWEDARDGGEKGTKEIYFARIDSGGLVYDSEVKISDVPGAHSRAFHPALATNNGNYALVWQDAAGDTSRQCIEKQECAHRIFFASISNVGKLNGPPLALTASGQDAAEPSLTSALSGYLLSYSDTSGDTSAECTANRGECDYQTVVASLDKDGKLQQSSTIPGAVSGTLVQEEGEPKAYLVAWADGVYLAEVSPGDAGPPIIKELSKKLIPVRGIPHLSVASGRENLWVAVSDMPEDKKPEDLYANDLWVYRVSLEGQLQEAKGFLASGNPSRSEKPFIAALGDDALVLWREVRPALFASCKERPQSCIADLAVSRISCGNGVQAQPPTPEFQQLIPDLMNGGSLWGEDKKPTPSNPPLPTPTPLPTPIEVPIPPPSLPY
jgi:hypothetical protein